MKIRQGFVTNSSSSSFIIATKKCCNANDIMNIFDKYRDDIEQMLRDVDIKYLNVPNIVKDAINIGDFYKATNLMIAYFTTRIGNFSPDLVLDDWKIISMTATNETDDVFEYFIYGWLGQNIDEPIFKISETY